MGTCVAGDARAFVFADGTKAQCTAGGKVVPEVDIPASAQADFTGRAVRSTSGYRILWNQARLSALPPAMHDFLFFHECAHAELATEEELAANCAGLKSMRAAGRGGLAVEARLTEFYGAGNPYWVRTLACANAPREPGSAPGGSGSVRGAADEKLPGR
ncbi:MAG: hypothetical protein M3Z31_00515 [Pseudomonadota bacterium]|nr:hypothetical protein [Pseudomonadota bacterium]